jgi:regulator of cell morphogenesis and NO signaling
MLVADLATASPSTIRVFQRHHIDFCCAGKVPLAEVCAHLEIDQTALMAELEASIETREAATDWRLAPLAELVGHIQHRFHQPLADELPRLHAMLDKVVSRHGDRLPDVLVPLQAAFGDFRAELTDHMASEDDVLFPAVIKLEAGEPVAAGGSWIDQPIAVMESEHAAAGAALAHMAKLTNGYEVPEDACPTFRGLYHGLAELERDMHLHVHLENHVLFPRAIALARTQSTR